MRLGQCINPVYIFIYINLIINRLIYFDKNDQNLHICNVCNNNEKFNSTKISNFEGQNVRQFQANL